MVRAAENDLLQAFRYHVIATPAAAGDPDPLSFTERLDGAPGGQAGFQSATLPDITVEAAEYREGTMQWTQKYPGPPTISDCSLMRGVAKKDTAFHEWVLSSVEGNEYRADVTIHHYDREAMGAAAAGPGAVDGNSVRRIQCSNCFGVRAKPGSDFDSSSGEVSIAECDFSMESFIVIPPTA